MRRKTCWCAVARAIIVAIRYADRRFDDPGGRLLLSTLSMGKFKPSKQSEIDRKKGESLLSVRQKPTLFANVGITFVAGCHQHETRGPYHTCFGLTFDNASGTSQVLSGLIWITAYEENGFSLRFIPPRKHRLPHHAELSENQEYI